MNIDNDRLDADGNDREREISLGTATIIGIFLALALVCAAFFGFGYSQGRHSAQTATSTSAPEVKADTAPEEAKPDFSHFKSSTPPAKKPNDEAEAPESQAAEAPAALKARPSNTQPVAFPAPGTPAASASPANPPVSSTGQFVVQISAPSRQGDADALIAALSRKGYKAYIRKEPQDSFFHVQVGPYATKPDAQAMVKRLDTDGYKPFIK